MNQDQIIEWAREAGFGIDDAPSVMQRYKVQPLHLKIDDELTRFAALVAAHEREACALVCDEQAQRSLAAAGKAKSSRDEGIYRNAAQTAMWNAAAIRAIGEKP